RAENGRMPSSWIALGLAAGCFSLGLATVIGLARSAERRNRRLARERMITLAKWWGRYATRGGDLRTVQRQARACDPALFWSVLESLSVELERKPFRRLTAVLARSRHVRDERWSMRDDSPWRRELAARRLSLIKGKGAKRALRAALQIGPEAVAYSAALGLARGRDVW